MEYYKRALEFRKETVTNRRWFHTHAEVGLHMPKAQAYVMERLTEYGLKRWILESAKKERSI